MKKIRIEKRRGRGREGGREEEEGGRRSREEEEEGGGMWHLLFVC